MTSVRLFTRAFSGGEVSPELYARAADVAHVQQSLAMCRNCIVLPHGPARNRTGTEFVIEVKNSATKTRLIPFSFNAVQTFAIELGAGYFRFHTLGETLLSGGVPYEITNPYAAADLFNIHYTQSADVLTLVHPSYPPMELQRLGATSWQLVPISFQPTAVAPTGVAATPTGTGTTSYSYKVTTVIDSDNLEESLASISTGTCTNDLTITGQSNVISWTAPAGALRVNVYKLSSGLYGYIGQADPSATFTDNNITADISQTPPLVDSTFDGTAGTYPAAVGYDEQRRFFAGWTNGPQNVIATRSGTESNVNYHIPTVADDRIAFRVAAREGSAIEHIVPVQELMLLTPTNVFRVSSTDGGALTGSTISIKPQAYLGANNVQPVIIDSTVIYAQAFGGRMTELSYNTTATGQFYDVNDITLLAPHLFDYKTVVDMAYARAPYPIVWVVNDEGSLLGMTYVPKQQVSAWHRHDTDGAFESCCVISEQGEDYLYVIVNRTINGATKRYVERLHTRQMPTNADAFFVDCGLTYSGTATDTISGGLDHLEGKTVSILGDGAVMPQQVVTGGALPDKLDAPCSTIHVGLPITADLQTLPIFVAGISDLGQGRPKNVNKVYLRMVSSSSVFAGPNFSQLREYKQRTTEPYGSPPNWINDEVEIMLDNAWATSGQVCIRQIDPLPLTLVSATLEVSAGG